MSSGHATLAELQTILGFEDLMDIIEIVQVDARNERQMSKKNARNS